jgi:hypothetical protein
MHGHFPVQHFLGTNIKARKTSKNLTYKKPKQQMNNGRFKQEVTTDNKQDPGYSGQLEKGKKEFLKYVF